MSRLAHPSLGAAISLLRSASAAITAGRPALPPGPFPFHLLPWRRLFLSQERINGHNGWAAGVGAQRVQLNFFQGADVTGGGEPLCAKCTQYS